jgi:predicted transcriptional regulator
MASAKDTMAEIIARQPDDSSYDEILRGLAFARMAKRGLQNSDAGRTISDDEMKGKVDSWRSPGKAKPQACAVTRREG